MRLSPSVRGRFDGASCQHEYVTSARVGVNMALRHPRKWLASCGTDVTDWAAAEQELSETLWALATLAVDPGPAATAALAARALALLPSLDWARACDLIYCLAAFGTAVPVAPGDGEKEQQAAGEEQAVAAAAVRRVLRWEAVRVGRLLEGATLSAPQVAAAPPHSLVARAPCGVVARLSTGRFSGVCVIL